MRGAPRGFSPCELFKGLLGAADRDVCRAVQDFLERDTSELVQLLSCQPCFLVCGVQPELSLGVWMVSLGQGLRRAPGFCQPLGNDYLSTFHIKEQHILPSACASAAF